MDQLTDQQVERLLSDETEFNRFFESLESVKTMNALYHEMLQSTTRELAESNLRKEEELQMTRERLQERRELLEARRAEVRQMQEKKQAILQKYSVDSLIAGLTAAAKEADAQSTEQEKRLLAQDIDVDTFLKEYRSTRELYHQRSAKTESLLLHHKR